MSESLVEKARRNAAEQGLKLPQKQPEFADDLIPAVPESGPRQRDELDDVLDRIDIVDAYRRWCGKMEPKIGSRRESIMVSCPQPGHADSNPSAWLNLDKGVGYCGVCDVGFDKYDLAAIHHNLDTKTNFRELRRLMGEDLGVVVTKTLAGATVVAAQTDEKPNVIQPAKNIVPDSDEKPAEPPTAEPPPPEPTFKSATEEIDWRSIIPDYTFMREWMKAVTIDDLPEEYYFWCGLEAVGLAVGNDATLTDNPPVKGNLFVCLFGDTGIGKSKAASMLGELLYEALPFDPNHPGSGVYRMPVPNSSEVMIDMFNKPLHDPAEPEKVIGHQPVRGYLQFDELASLVARIERASADFGPNFHALYDSRRPLTTASRGTGSVWAKDHFGSITATTQPRAIRDILAQRHSHSGFLNRWIFATGRTKPPMALGNAPPDLTQSVEELRHLHAWAAKVRHIHFDKPGLDAWTEYFLDTLHPLKAKHELLSRLDLTFKKLMLLFAVNEKSDVITDDIVKRVSTLHNYLVDNYRMLATSMPVTNFEDIRDRIMDVARKLQKKNKDAPTLRQIDQYVGNQYPRELVERAVKNLVTMGSLEEERTAAVGKRGRPSLRYRPS